MKTLAITKYLFTLVGLGMLTGAFFLYQNTSNFLEHATRVDGTVIELIPSHSSDSTTYKPVVAFTTLEGQKLEVTSSVSTNPPAYSKGESVDIFYLPAEPHNAKISGYFSFWGVATILAGMGLVFFMIGAGIMLSAVLKTRKEEYLKAEGVRITTEFQSVDLNKSITVNGRHPFRVLCQWQHPVTSEIHIFKSNNIWYDPSSYMTKHITVFIEKNNPKKYYVDLSFLPKLAQ
ncbi:MAG: DUF3592 domain-containing protein [Gammaproteobacteria bacterium]|nr:DUF3592 domain-containing protein [Gammaproteobacteria bacterium]